jgi:hypothetical protein
VHCTNLHLSSTSAASTRHTSTLTAAGQPPATTLWFTGQSAAVFFRAVCDGTICTYDGAMIYFYAGKNSRAQWEATMKASGMGSVKQEPVAGVGDSAYAFFVSPQSASIGPVTC